MYEIIAWTLYGIGAIYFWVDVGSSKEIERLMDAQNRSDTHRMIVTVMIAGMWPIFAAFVSLGALAAIFFFWATTKEKK